MIESIKSVRTIAIGISTQTQMEVHAPVRTALFTYLLQDNNWSLQGCTDEHTDDGKTPCWVRTVIERRLPNSIVGDGTETTLLIRPTERISRMLGVHTTGIRTHPHGLKLRRRSSIFDPASVRGSVVVLAEDQSDLKEFRITGAQFDDYVRKLKVTMPAIHAQRPALAVL